MCSSCGFLPTLDIRNHDLSDFLFQFREGFFAANYSDQEGIFRIINFHSLNQNARSPGSSFDRVD